MTISLGDISVRYVNLILETARELGANVEELKHQYQLTGEHLRQANARISIPRFMRLGHSIIEDTGCKHLGLIAGKTVAPSVFGLAGLLAQTAPSLKVAIDAIARFEQLSSKNVRGHSTAYPEKSNYVAEFYSLSPYNEFNFFVVDLALASEFAAINAIMNQTVPLHSVDIEFSAPEHTDIYEAIFNCPVNFNASRNALKFNAKNLTLKPKQANHVSYAECLAICEAELDKLSRPLSFAEQVMERITPLLHSTNLSLEQVSSAMEMPSWTLRRKLQAEGLSFRNLVDETRKSLALIYIKDPRYSLGEIAYLLGFANPNGFQRAFKRWTGKAPGTFRQKNISGFD